MQDLIDLRSPGAFSASREHTPEEEDFSFQPVVPTLKLPTASRQPAHFTSLIDDLVGNADSNEPSTPSQLGLGHVTEHVSEVPTAELLCLTTPRPAASHDNQPPSTLSTSEVQPQPELSDQADTRHAANSETDAHAHQKSSLPSAGPPPGTDDAMQRQLLEKELEETKLKLLQTETARAAVAREMGAQKGVVCKLEGRISSFEKQTKAAVEEIASLRARLAVAEREAAEAKAAAGITPERCRASARALVEETQRVDQARQQKELELQRAQAMLATEVQEMTALKEYMGQEHQTLLDINKSLSSQLENAKSSEAAAQQRCRELLAQADRLQRELNHAKAEMRDQSAQIWKLNNEAIELRAEAGAAKTQAATSQAAVAAVQEQVAREVEAKQRVACEAREVQAAGIKLYKQIRAVAHALETHMHHFQPIPKVALSIRSLQDWCTKQGPYWSAQAAAAAEAEKGEAGGSAVGASGQSVTASNGSNSSGETGPPAGMTTGDETLNLNSALARLPNSSGSVCMTAMKKRG